MNREKKTYYLIYTFFVVFILATYYIVYHNYTEQKKIYSDQFNENQFLIIRQVVKSVESYIEDMKHDVEIFAASESLRGGSVKEELRDLLSFYKLSNGEISTIRIYDNHGLLMLALPSKFYKEKVYDNFSNESYFNVPLLEKEIFVSKIHVDDIGERVITISTPIFYGGVDLLRRI